MTDNSAIASSAFKLVIYTLVMFGCTILIYGRVTSVILDDDFMSIPPCNYLNEHTSYQALHNFPKTCERIQSAFAIFCICFFRRDARGDIIGKNYVNNIVTQKPKSGKY